MTIINSSEATLKTLSVTISTLSVNERQMTLSVFRQLPVIKVIDRGKIQGQSWGIVRYKIKDEGDVWVVVEKDGVLHRSLVPGHIDTEYEKNKIGNLRSKLGLLEEELEDAGDENAYSWRHKRAREEILRIQRDITDTFENMYKYDKHNEAYAEYKQILDKLPQLFIAV